MLTSSPVKYFTTLVLAILVATSSAQNVTNTTDVPLFEVSTTTTAEPVTPVTIATTIPSSTNNVTLPTTEADVTVPPEPKILQDLSTSSEKPPDIAASVVPQVLQEQKLPPDCSHREKLRNQPKPTSSSKLRKCCPHGETLFIGNDSAQCKSLSIEFSPEVDTVELYDNCIESLEIRPNLPIEIGNPCNESFMYSPSRGDRLLVQQDGSLLVMDQHARESYNVETLYCLDTSIETGEVFAIVCVSSVEEHVGTGQTILYTFFMLVSIPCLAIVTFLHLGIKQLRSVHGLSLSVMSACLAIGFTLHTLAQISDYHKSGLGYAVQFFMLSYFFWLLNLCSNVVLHVWYYLPKKVDINYTIRYLHFVVYVLFAFSIPLILVLMTKSKGLPGMPSYFFQGFTESIRESQRYFIPPVTIVLFISFWLLVASFFGFKQLTQINSQGGTYEPVAGQTVLPTLDQEGYQEIKKDAKCICFLFIIIITTWVLEAVTFYQPGPADYIAFMEIVNGLQGVFILMIFIVVRRRRIAIVHWWHDRGSHELRATEMRTIENGTQSLSK